MYLFNKGKKVEMKFEYNITCSLLAKILNYTKIALSAMIKMHQSF